MSEMWLYLRFGLSFAKSLALGAGVFTVVFGDVWTLMSFVDLLSDFVALFGVGIVFAAGALSLNGVKGISLWILQEYRELAENRFLTLTDGVAGARFDASILLALGPSLSLSFDFSFICDAFFLAAEADVGFDSLALRLTGDFFSIWDSFLYNDRSTVGKR